MAKKPDANLKFAALTDDEARVERKFNIMIDKKLNESAAPKTGAKENRA